MPMPGRHGAEVAKGRLAPAQKGVAFAVALELQQGIGSKSAGGAELVDLHGMIDDQLGGASGLTRSGSPPRVLMASRIAARSTTAGTPVKSCISTRAGI
jgi:hypothetical protein